MAITSELLGKLGGADVEVIPVSVPVGNATLCSLDLRTDKTYLVGVSGVSPKMPTGSYVPRITIGGRFTGYAKKKNQKWGTAGMVSGPVDVIFRPYSTSPTLTSDFEGIVYVVEVSV